MFSCYSAREIAFCFLSFLHWKAQKPAKLSDEQSSESVNVNDDYRSDLVERLADWSKTHTTLTKKTQFTEQNFAYFNERKKIFDEIIRHFLPSTRFSSRWNWKRSPSSLHVIKERSRRGNLEASWWLFECNLCCYVEVILHFLWRAGEVIKSCIELRRSFFYHISNLAGVEEQYCEKSHISIKFKFSFRSRLGSQTTAP